MTLQPVISEIANVATSLLFKADLGRHSLAGATGVTGSLFLRFSSTYITLSVASLIQLETTVTQLFHYQGCPPDCNFYL